MALSITHFLLSCLLSFQLSFSFSLSWSSLRMGSSLSVENPEDILVSPNGMFTAGFHAIGENAYSFAIWFTEANSQSPNTSNTVTFTWMANRDKPVNGKRSKLSLTHTSNIVLLDAASITTWSSNTNSLAPTSLHLQDDGNLVLLESQGTVVLWQSFDFPTDTLVPGQPLTRHTKLVSARSQSDHSSGFYRFFFGDDNILRLVYSGPYVSSNYWPDPERMSWLDGRSLFNSSRIAALDSLGRFHSSDNFTFVTSDYGTLRLQRKLKLDSDGNLRVYGRKSAAEEWYVSWQAIRNGCYIHGVCGPNSTCGYDPETGKSCKCLPGYKLKNHTDWSDGCEPLFDLTCNGNESTTTFLEMRGVEFYGYNNYYVEVSNYSACEALCLQNCTCVAFQYSYSIRDGFFYGCYTKTQLLNGRRLARFPGATYLRMPKSFTLSSLNESASIDSIDVNHHVCSVQLQRDYIKTQASHVVMVLLWFATALGAFEVVCVFVIWCFLFRTSQKSKNADQQGYHLAAATGFRKFSYSELKKATKGFSEEIGRGGGGVVYKAILSDQRHAAIKRLYNAKQGEGEFLAEVGIIGRLNHMNLIEMWGYCAEGKHRLLVYEYMENGSLAQNLSSNTLDWSKRYDIALGTARVLAYLHEECLEWILHCDIKPQNILLDSNYQPRLADFGLSKLLNRNNPKNQSISMIRGTRGYMAPEWVFNLPITSKVDVYSYGIVVLEMVTGKSPTTSVNDMNGEEAYDGRLVAWVREKRSNNNSSTSGVEQIIEPAFGPNHDKSKMEIMTTVALNCVVEDRDSRPTMSQVVEMLQSHQRDDSVW